MNRRATSSHWRPIGSVTLVALGATIGALTALTDAHAGAMPRRAPARHAEAPPAYAPAAPAPQSQAQEAFVAGRYAEAYGRYASLADAGDAQAAFMALLLVANGPAVFGGEWSATPGQLQRWNALAARHVQAHRAEIVEHDRGE